MIPVHDPCQRDAGTNGLAAGIEAVRSTYGPWTAHNIELAPGVFTHPESSGAPNLRVRQVVQVVCDLLGRDDLGSLRLADLGALEGGFAIECALRGAEVVGVEGRESNLARARFAASALALEDRVEFVLDDVRNFTRARYGRFDVVLCLGLLYHLDGPDIFDLLGHLADVATRFVLIDTHISLGGGYTLVHAGHTYEGRPYQEPHDDGTTGHDRGAYEWSSLGNPRSFWLTKQSLLVALGQAGFSSVMECHWPQSPRPRADRIQLVAMSGQHVDVKTVPTPAVPPELYVLPEL